MTAVGMALGAYPELDSKAVAQVPATVRLRLSESASRTALGFWPACRVVAAECFAQRLPWVVPSLAATR